MSEFVSYTGPNASENLETRRKIRSQVMRDFRRRQRENDRVASEPERRSKKTDTRHHVARNPAPMATTRNVSQPKAVPYSSVRFAFDNSVVDDRCTSRSGCSLSTTPELVPSNVDLPSARNVHLTEATSEYAAVNPHMAMAASHTASVVPATPRPTESQQRVLDIANGDDKMVKYRAIRPATFQSSQARQACWTCPHQIHGCSDCKSKEDIRNLQIQDQGTIWPAYESVSALSLADKPCYNLSLLSSSSPNDQEALQYFQRVVVKDVSGIVTIGFWERLVPLMCSMEDAARQAAIALSQAHMEQSAGRASLEHFPHRGHSGLSSLQSEIKASQALSSYIEKAATPSYELVLTCSIMLHTLESMLGRRISALLHLENGLRMYKAWQKERKHDRSNVNEEAHALSTAFARLDLSATISDDDRIPLFEYDDASIPSLSEQELLPYMAFTNSRDAHHQLMRIGTPAWEFLIRNRKWRKVNYLSVPRGVIEEQQMHRSRYRAWTLAMDMYESDRLCYYSHTTTKEQKEHRRAEHMSLLATRMHHWCAKRMLEESLPTEHTVNFWDRNPHKLLRHAKAVLEYTEEIKTESGHKGQASFSPEIGICGILLCLAHRTALPHIRSEALGLAQSFDRQEGSQDLCGAFTSWTKLPQPRPAFTFMLDEPGH